MKPVRILNFDGSLLKQRRLREKYQPDIIDLSAIGPMSRTWLNQNYACKVRSALHPDSRQAFTLYGSGDFHHISALLIEQFSQPINVIVFDHHPDWDILPPRLGCGSWVSQVLRRPNVEKVLLLGVGSDDLDSVSIQTGNLNALRDDRVEIYPYQHQPTVTLLKKIPDNISLRVQRHPLYSTIYWRYLKDANKEALFSEILSRLKSRQVYVSIDKDCLAADYSLTNWEPGAVPLPDVVRLLKLIKENLDIIGLDICGEYSVNNVSGPFKAMCSWIDHPRQYSAKNKPDEVITRVNEDTNLALLAALFEGDTYDTAGN